MIEVVIKLKKTLGQILSIGLLGLSLYQVLISLQDISLVVKIMTTNQPVGDWNTWLEKFAWLSVTTMTDLTYGIFLVIHPARLIKTFHLILGIIIFTASLWVSFNFL